MEAPGSTRAALLETLFHGPAEADALARRLGVRGRGRTLSNPTGIARALRELAREGLVRRWRARPSGRAGRSVQFYELTSEGVAQALREGAGSLAGPAARRRRAAGAAVNARLRRSLDLSAVAASLRRRSKSPRHR